MKKHRHVHYVLAIDIGNSSISFGLFENTKILRTWHGNIDIIPKIGEFINHSGINSKSVQIIIDSVNPQKLGLLVKLLRKNFKNQQPLILGKTVKIKIAHKYKQYSKLGQDRIVNLAGALQLYRPPILIIDYGTAITFDVISLKGVFEGGLIIPGVEIAWKALQDRTALLPKFNLEQEILRRKELVGNDTKSCMTAGIGHSYGAMTDGLIGRFRSKYGKKLQVLVTGGFSRFIQSHIRQRVIVDPNHTLKSLALINFQYSGDCCS